MPSIIFWFLNCFKKKKAPQKTEEVIDLWKWEQLKRLPDPYIGDIFYNCKDLNEIAMALAHSDEKTVKRFLWMADHFRNTKEQLEPLINEYSDISKKRSDKMKAHVANYSGIGKPGYFQPKDWKIR